MRSSGRRHFRIPSELNVSLRYRSGQEDRLHHYFNLGRHFLSRNAVGSLVPASCGSEDSPGSSGCEHSGVGARCHSVFCGAFLKYVLYHRDDGAFERQPGQLSRAASALGEVIADPERNGSQRTVAICKGKTASRDEVTEAGGCHGLEQGILVRIVEIKGRPVQGGFVCDLLNGDIIELLAIQ